LEDHKEDRHEEHGQDRRYDHATEHGRTKATLASRTGPFGAGAIVVNVGGTLGGTGITTGNVNVFGTLAPGASTESLAVGNLTMQSGSIFEIEVGGLTAGAAVNGYDQLNVTGTVNLGNATLDVSTLSFTPEEDDAFFILTNDGVDAINGTFNGITNDSIVKLNGQNWRVRYNADYATLNLALGSGNDIVLIAVPPVPEPSMLALIAGGGACLALRQRRRETDSRQTAC